MFERSWTVSCKNFFKLGKILNLLSLETPLGFCLTVISIRRSIRAVHCMLFKSTVVANMFDRAWFRFSVVQSKCEYPSMVVFSLLRLNSLPATSRCLFSSCSLLA